MRLKKRLIAFWRNILHEKIIQEREVGEYYIDVRGILDQHFWISAKYTIESQCMDVQEVYAHENTVSYYYDLLIKKLIELAGEKKIKNIAATLPCNQRGAVYMLGGFMSNGFLMVDVTDEVYIVAKEL